MKGRMACVVVCALAGLLLGVCIAVPGERQATMGSAGTRLLATVGGVEIDEGMLAASRRGWEATIEANRALLEEQGEPTELAGEVPTDGELLERMIRLRVLEQEAERLGLVATDAQIDAYLAVFDEGIRNQDEGALAALAHIEEYAAGMGMTYAQYRAEVEYALQRMALSVEAVEAHYHREPGATDRLRREARVVYY